MTPFYTFTTPVFRGFPSSLFPPSLSSLWLTLARGGPNRHWAQSGQSESHTKRNYLCTIRCHEHYKNKNSLLRRCEPRLAVGYVTVSKISSVNLLHLPPHRRHHICSYSVARVQARQNQC